jgi:hypothetical protein
MSGVTNASGVFTTTLASTLAQTETVTATEGSVQENTSVTFVAPIVNLPSATASLQAAANPNTAANGSTQTFNGPIQPPGAAVSESYPADPAGAYPAGYATASALTSLPEVTAESAGNAVASSTMTYYFEISGPANVTVPITFSGIFTDQGGTNENGITFTDLGATITNLVGVSPYTVLGDAGYTTPIIPFTVTANATSNVPYQVQLFADADSSLAGQVMSGPPNFGNSNFGPAQYVDVDSTISISSTFSNANQF